LPGNPLAVVIKADVLTDEQMSAFANWTNLSETTFLLKPRSPAADYRVRIFNSEREVPFAGHHTLGSCQVRLSSGGLPKRSEIVQECGLGLVPIRRSGEVLSFAAPKLIRSGPVGAEILARAVRGLDLRSGAITASNSVDNGSGWLAVMLRSREEVLALRPNHTLLAGLKVGVFAAFDPSKDGSFAQFEVRAFSAEAAVGHEDPVTGSLNAGLARWLIESGMARSRYIVSQGTSEANGRSSNTTGRFPDMGRWNGQDVCHGHSDVLNPSISPAQRTNRVRGNKLQFCRPPPGLPTTAATRFGQHSCRITAGIRRILIIVHLRTTPAGIAQFSPGTPTPPEH
jgi:PhzF family phenazine biosynthesis protein